MKMLSSISYKVDASYEDLMVSTDARMRDMKRVVLEEGVVFFLYRGLSDKALVMFRTPEGVHMQVCPCDVKRSDPDLIYAMCYGV